MYKTNELMKKANVSRETIRYYENRGLIHPISRTECGYKLYNEQTIVKIKFIKQIQRLTFSLREIEEILGIISESEDPYKELINTIDNKMKNLKKKKSNLKKIKESLEHRCTTYERSNQKKLKCPIMRDFVEIDLDEE